MKSKEEIEALLESMKACRANSKELFIVMNAHLNIVEWILEIPTEGSEVLDKMCKSHKIQTHAE